MIIPSVKLPDDSDQWANELVKQLEHWSLFGRVALTGISTRHVLPLEKVLEQVGGQADIMIELTDPADSDAILLLNAGATSVVAESFPEGLLPTVPEDRCVLKIVDDSSDQAIAKGSVIELAEPTAERIAELEMARIDCLVNIDDLDDNPEMIADFLQKVLVTDREDGLWSTVIVDSIGTALGLAYSNYESLLHAIKHRCGAYWSRSRKGLWIKGETSGALQKLLGIRFDCDRDCLRFMVQQDPPGFCHLKTHSCFGEERTIAMVVQRLADRIQDTDEKSFTRKLANDAKMLEAKLLEEAQELSDASQTDDPHEVAWEAADVLYFSLVAMLKNGVSLDRVFQELARRMNRVVRRKNKLETPQSVDEVDG